MFEQFIEWAKANGWEIIAEKSNVDTLPKEITDRYAVPKEYKQFLSQTASCIKEDTTWFLCFNDYRPQPKGSFRWNEFEHISLDAADGDEEWTRSIKDFWDSHLPFIMSVESGYAYYAFDITDGSVVFGEEPEFEETTTAAESFDEFLAKVVSYEIIL